MSEQIIQFLVKFVDNPFFQDYLNELNEIA
jgi:hypothetical protein